MNYITEQEVLDFINSDDKVLFLEAKDDVSIIKKLVARKKIKKRLNDIFKMELQNIKIRVNINKFESQKREEKDPDKKAAYDSKIEAAKNSIKSTDELIKDKKKLTETLARENQLSEFFVSRSYIMNTHKLAAEIKLTDDKDRVAELTKAYKGRADKTEQFLKKEKELQKEIEKDVKKERGNSTEDDYAKMKREEEEEKKKQEIEEKAKEKEAKEKLKQMLDKQIADKASELESKLKELELDSQEYKDKEEENKKILDKMKADKIDDLKKFEENNKKNKVEN